MMMFYGFFVLSFNCYFLRNTKITLVSNGDNHLSGTKTDQDTYPELKPGHLAFKVFRVTQCIFIMCRWLKISCKTLLVNFPICNEGYTMVKYLDDSLSPEQNCCSRPFDVILNAWQARGHGWSHILMVESC